MNDHFSPWCFLVGGGQGKGGGVHFWLGGHFLQKCGGGGGGGAADCRAPKRLIFLKKHKF